MSANSATLAEWPNGSSLMDRLCWAEPAGMFKRLEALLPAEGEGALSAADKDRRLAELAEQLLELERAEEALVAKTGATRRPDADPRAVLGVAEATAVEADAA